MAASSSTSSATCWTSSSKLGGRGRRTFDMRVAGRLAALLAALAVLACADEDLEVMPPPVSSSATVEASVLTPEPRVIAPGITVNFWEPPLPGWLLVVDGDPDYDEASPWRVLLVEPATGELRGRIETGYWPHIALSPDGQTVYLTSAVPGNLAALRSSDLALLWWVDLDPLRSNPPRAPLPAMRVSADGRFLYVGLLSRLVVAIDASSGWALGEWGGTSCAGIPSLWPGVGEADILITDCDGELYGAKASAAGIIVTELSESLGLTEPAERVLAVLRDLNEQTQLVAIGGTSIAIERTAPSVTDVVVLPALSRETWSLVPPAIAPDGSWLLLPTREPTTNSGFLAGDALHRVALDDKPEVVASFERPNGISFVTLSPDATEVYVLDRDARTLVVLEAATLTELRAFAIPGASMPLEAIVVP